MKIKKHFFVILLIFVILIFMSGFIFGRVTQSTELSEVEIFIKESELNTRSYVLEQDLLSENEEISCSISQERLNNLASRTSTLGQKLDDQDQVGSISKEDYDYLKRRYHLDQMRLYVQTKQHYDSCPGSKTPILFFYTPSSESSLEQGEILDQVVENKDLTVLAIQYDYSPDLEFVQTYFGITTTPSLVINYDTKVVGLTGYDNILEILGET